MQLKKNSNDIFEPLEGLSDKSANMYDYTINAAKNSEGKQVAYAWQATPGAFFYRTDMAKELLGIDKALLRSLSLNYLIRIK